MPKTLTQYDIFIGSPGGLGEERKRFKAALEKVTRMHAAHKQVLFHAVGWEDTLNGAGRPQSIINAELERCDYAVFVLHERWGMPPGGRHSSGTEEEFTLAEKLYQDTKIRQIALFFKAVDGDKSRTPEEQRQLDKVLAFKARITKGRRYLYKIYDTPDQFAEILEAHLGKWLHDHTDPAGTLLTSDSIMNSSAVAAKGDIPVPVITPDFDYWIVEAKKLVDGVTSDHAAVLFCARKAVDMARSDLEWAEATHVCGIARLHLGEQGAALTLFTTIADRFSAATDAKRRGRHAWALIGKGSALGQLGRKEEEVAVYDDVLARFGAAPEAPLREGVARALFNKGVTLSELGRNDEAVAVYDDVLARFGAAPEAPLREQVARAFVNKGFRLGQLGRGEEEIAAYDDVLARFGTAPEAPLREGVARALVNKGVRLEQLGRGEEAVAVCDDVLARFGTAPEVPIREQVANVLVSKGVRLGQLGHSEEAVTVYDDVLARFDAAPEAPLREWVASALFNKGVTLGQLDRGEEAVAVCDDMLARFGAAPEAPLRERVAAAKRLKAALLRRKG